MRLWHKTLLPYLPRQQLLGQHRECCALRGKGWGKKHSTVNYVFESSYLKLSEYHKKVMFEMQVRGYKVDKKWFTDSYRGKQLGRVKFEDLPNINYAIDGWDYFEHNKKYLNECLLNLKNKGIEINFKK